MAEVARLGATVFYHDRQKGSFEDEHGPRYFKYRTDLHNNVADDTKSIKVTRPENLAPYVQMLAPDASSSESIHFARYEVLGSYVILPSKSECKLCRTKYEMPPIPLPSPGQRNIARCLFCPAELYNDQNSPIVGKVMVTREISPSHFNLSGAHTKEMTTKHGEPIGRSLERMVSQDKGIAVQEEDYKGVSVDGVDLDAVPSNLPASQRPESMKSISSKASSYRSAMASLRSVSTYASALSNLRDLSIDRRKIKPGLPTNNDEDDNQSQSEYLRLVLLNNLLLPPEDELNWSGRGQHVEFAPDQSLPLMVQHAIGHSGTALVDQITCRRIKLARKSMKINRRVPLERALNEVVHLQRLRHPHIIQLVGSYLQGKTFAILLYPVCDFNLTSFMETTSSDIYSSEYKQKSYELGWFPKCIIHAVDYIHRENVKHMDIKPQNILVRRLSDVPSESRSCYRVYIADFGISRHFKPDHNSETDSPIDRSFKYCAPEVFRQDTRGRPADIFSLGCVFTEILTILVGKTLDDFEEYRYRSNGSYHDNLPRVTAWIHHPIRSELAMSAWAPTQFLHQLSQCTLSMLEEDPKDRPSSSTIKKVFWSDYRHCCIQEREAYEIDQNRTP